MRLVLSSVLAILLGALTAPAVAGNGDFNNDFFNATVLEPGVLSVFDDLGSGAFPDTILGARGLFGGIVAFSDDDGPFEGQLGSALYDVPIQNGEVSFSISGFGDDRFVGDHSEFGDIEASVTVYDFFGDQIDFFMVFDTLEPGLTIETSESNFNYFNGSYDVEVNNTIGGGDVDFFTFTGLTEGNMFTAEVLDPDEFFVDSVLGWFDDSGNLITFNDDISNSDLRSRLSGEVPTSGELTFAVTGHPDFDFIGDHSEDWTYELALFVVPNEVFPGDANGDGSVDLLDLDILGANFGLTGTATVAEGDFNGDTNVDLLDLDILGQNFGATAGAVPEPGSFCLLVAAAASVVCRRRMS
ncbi:MAG: hypothetical protein AAF266_08930 [Planctomycetota bacterium]